MSPDAPVARVFGNEAGSTQAFGMAPTVQGLRQRFDRGGAGGAGGATARAGGGKAWSREEAAVAQSLAAINSSARRRIAASRRLVSLAAARGSAGGRAEAAWRGRGAGGGTGAEERAAKVHTNVAALFGAAASLAPASPLDGLARARAEDADPRGQQARYRERLSRFRRLKAKVKRWRKYFQPNRYDGIMHKVGCPAPPPQPLQSRISRPVSFTACLPLRPRGDV